MTEIGQLLKSRYLISNRLSGGGFSVTYLAKDTHLPDRPDCVVKQLKISSDDPEQVEKAREFFFNEAQTLRKLGRIHSQIPELLAYLLTTTAKISISSKNSCRGKRSGKSWTVE